VVVILLLGSAPVHANGEVMIAGRDLGVPVYGSSIMVFGDTTDQQNIHGGPAYTLWPNSVGVRNGQSVTPTVYGAWTPLPPGLTSTPTGGLKLGQCLYVWNMNVTDNSGNEFAVSSSGLAVSCDGGGTWTEHLLFDGPTPFSQATPYGAILNGYVYLLGTGGGRMAPAILARVAAGRLLDATAYAFWNGARWGSLKGAVPVIQDTVGELSLSWNVYLHQYLILYQSPASGGVLYRTASALSGPWSAPTVIIPQAGSGFYAPEQLVATTGQVVEYALSDFDIYSVIWMTLRLP
jgi:hypothetical protein